MRDRVALAAALRLIAIAWFVGGAVPVTAKEPVDFPLNGLPTRFVTARDFYPLDLRRANRGGRVALAYSVDSTGKLVRMSVLASSHTDFEPAAMAALKDLRVTVPADWESTGGPWRRFHVYVTFSIEGDRVPPAWVENVDALAITGSPWPNSR